MRILRDQRRCVKAQRKISCALHICCMFYMYVYGLQLSEINK